MRTVAGALLVLAALEASPAAAQDITLPRRPRSIRFAVIGDAGTGDRPAYETAARITAAHQKFPFTFAILLGDNLYGSERPQDFERKFSRPYQALLDAKVEFYAALGNHDDQNQRFYKPFNMGGERYYTFRKGNVRFFVVDSNYLDPDQVKWLDQQLGASGSDWKIVYFHHPIYSSGLRHGPTLVLRAALEPLLATFGVQAVFTGHEHFYERLEPRYGLQAFIAGSGGQLRKGGIRPGSIEMAAGYDQDNVFVLAEIAGDTMRFEAVTRLGEAGPAPAADST